jgi:hypothetical protein
VTVVEERCRPLGMSTARRNRHAYTITRVANNFTQ